MRTGIGLALVVLLASSAGYQIYATVQPHGTHVLLPGAQLNRRSLEPDSKARLKDGNGCFIAWVIDPDCPACQKLAARHGLAMTGVPQFFWLMVGTDAKVNAFISRYRLSPVQVLMTPPADAKATLSRLGITATPTRIIASYGNLKVLEVRTIDQELTEHPQRRSKVSCPIGNH